MKAWPALLFCSVPAAAAPTRDLGRGQVTPALEDDVERFQSGFAAWGFYLRNPRNAASGRPDGSGSALMKYHGYVNDAMNADRLRAFAELDFVTDRRLENAFKPSSFEYLLGMSTRRGDWRIQAGRQEGLTLRGPEKSYRFWEAQGSLLLGSHAAGGSARQAGPWDGWAGALTVGYLLHNSDTPARGDGSGLAHLRYAGFLETGFAQGRLILRGDADFLTDRLHRRFNPADLDLALGLGTSVSGLEIMLQRRSRESLDRPGYSLYYLLTLLKRFDGRVEPGLE